jgi:hypothetical protein
MKWLLLVSLTGALVVVPTARLIPVDQAAQDPSLKRTRDALLEAVKSRDAAAVLQYVSPTVVVDASEAAGGQGWETLANSLSVKLGAQHEHADWIGLDAALSLGGAFTTTRGAVFGRREFCAPYVFGAFPETLPDSVQGENSPWALTRKDVDVRQAPDASSPLIAKLSYALLQAPGDVHRDPKTARMWQAVELPGGREAFVPADAIWNPAGYHVCMAKIDGRWLVSAFNSHGSV